MSEWITPPSWALSLSERLLKEAPGDVPLTEVFAAGLAAERERCALITENFSAEFDAGLQHSFFSSFVRRETKMIIGMLNGLANAIRKGEE